jgi:hypothetical protein
MDNAQPYISLVVTARNDDHGGNLLGRMQIFVNGWIAQCRRHNLPSELIIVEWNPPTDRSRLRHALRWPEDFGPCQVRFIEVPDELHGRYTHSDRLPLYQMIAKNVGIRRARGHFILATNIDILFSNELVAFLAGRQLEPGRMYRVDRYDAMGEVPLEASLDEQLEYCRTHVLRINSLTGTVATSPAGRPEPESSSKRVVILWRQLQGVIHRMASEGRLVTVTFPVSPTVTRAARFYLRWGGLIGMTRNVGRLLQWKRPLLKTAAAGQSSPEIESLPKFEFLHTNGCGDFTLAARQHWFDLRGYPEFDLFSMNIDSVFCYAAHYGGAREEVLPEPMRIYHIEHATGSGWTPEGQDQLFKRIAAKGLGFVSYGDVIGWAEQMRRLNCTMIFNHEDWGLANFDLTETEPAPGPATFDAVRASAERA